MIATKQIGKNKKKLDSETSLNINSDVCHLRRYVTKRYPTRVQICDKAIPDKGPDM